MADRIDLVAHFDRIRGDVDDMIMIQAANASNVHALRRDVQWLTRAATALLDHVGVPLPPPVEDADALPST